MFRTQAPALPGPHCGTGGPPGARRAGGRECASEAPLRRLVSRLEHCVDVLILLHGRRGELLRGACLVTRCRARPCANPGGPERGAAPTTPSAVLVETVSSWLYWNTPTLLPYRSSARQGGRSAAARGGVSCQVRPSGPARTPRRLANVVERRDLRHLAGRALGGWWEGAVVWRCSV